ncbi:efflux RND transporter periplasmic adaptor subunit [Pseudoalteromonas mariniglutinosa]|uniref:efflux RND transporter periplasmic adaptor subunit n=1 Tax=Pseudoalteromonas mariniglutinosa TaxID=206042 RepID=UPI00384F6E4D
MYFKNCISYALCCVCFGYLTSLQEAEAEHAHNHPTTKQTTNNQPASQTEVSLTPQQIELAGIEVAVLKAKPYQAVLYAPAEIKANGYASYAVSPRVDSVVVKRHVLLGQTVEQGAALVTLFSAQVASQQTQFKLAHAQWQRVSKMTKGTVSEKQMLNAKSEFEASYSQLVAFGLSKTDINNTLTIEPQKLGEYTLYANISGVVLSDNFVQGQRLDAGRELMLVADESQLWVEAQLSAQQDYKIAEGAIAKVVVNDQQYSATVIQEAHTIDSKTRSRIIRLSISNQQHLLHSGLFAQVYFNLAGAEAVLAVPEHALSRNSDGDWQVFVRDSDGGFIATEVSLGERFGNYQQIIGLDEGHEVVVQGAFFVASQLAKSGFDPHNH